MQYREKLGYIALGGGLMLIGVLAAGSFTPLGGQNEEAVASFETIVCRKLVVERSQSDRRRVTIDSSLADRTKAEPYVMIGGSAGILLLSAAERENPRASKFEDYGETYKMFLEAYDLDLEQYYIRMGAITQIGKAYQGYVAVSGKGAEVDVLMPKGE